MAKPILKFDAVAFEVNGHAGVAVGTTHHEESQVASPKRAHLI